MKTQFVCLANSYKEGGRCLAGIGLENGNPVVQNGKPKWIRPICETVNGEIPIELVSHIDLLDIVEIDLISSVSDSYQSENVLFDTNSIKITGKFSINNFENLCDNSQTVLFGNKGGAVAPENIELLTNSLRMIKVTKCKVVEKKYGDSSHQKLRLAFTFANIAYEIPITDPAFLYDYKWNKNLLTNSPNIFVVVSLGICFQNWYWKLVAAIFYS